MTLSACGGILFACTAAHAEALFLLIVTCIIVVRVDFAMSPISGAIGRGVLMTLAPGCDVLLVRPALCASGFSVTVLVTSLGLNV
ncbi:MAG: hypothetical protein JWM11_2510 [Planctomycetaceae bacterium]|nr:hypothetical protein [Planctomycetaceae bacterium]